VPADLSIEDLSAAIKEKARELGFSGCGFSRAEALPEDKQRLEAWLQQGYHARMGYMANHMEKRTDPTELVKGARSVISLLYNYYTEKGQKDPDAPILSKYAYGTDYHFVLKDKMHELFAMIKTLVIEQRPVYCIYYILNIFILWYQQLQGFIFLNRIFFSQSDNNITGPDPVQEIKLILCNN
jgi:epoxyqueuosine reductase QueG